MTDDSKTTEAASCRELLGDMAGAAKQVLALAPFGLPEDVATLHGTEAAEELQSALERLRNAVAEYEA